ncbi:MAG: GNAT family N-acetyltransferase [Gemmatimonadota bacterium]
MTRRATDVVVRRASVRDLDAVVAMRVALIAASRKNPAYRRLRGDYEATGRQLFEAQLTDARGLTLIAESDGKPVGLLRCTISGANPLYEPARHAYVVSVYVLPSHRRRGVLKQLLGAADRWCVEQGIQEMRLHVGFDNEAGNAAWQALGFEPAEMLRVRSIPAFSDQPSEAEDA